jgi:cytochrome c-type biogenesis protein CcmH/NrfG
MIVVAGLAALAVAAVAAAGVLHPFRRGNAPTLERQADPLEEQRRTLLRSLRDLDEERSSGAIGDEEYRSLRREVEVRAVSVLRALQTREGPAEGRFHELRPVPEPSSGNGQPEGARPGRVRMSALPTLLVIAAVAAVAVPLLSSAIHDRAPGASITGNDATGELPISFFERRVEQHPDDVAARLDLAARYERAGQVTDAAGQYLAALRMNPNNAEANANVGYLLYRSGQAEAGLEHAERSLQADPGYPEGLFVKGVILSRGLHRNAAAAAALRAYLEVAPLGSHREEARRLLRSTRTRV